MPPDVRTEGEYLVEVRRFADPSRSHEGRGLSVAVIGTGGFSATMTDAQLDTMRRDLDVALTLLTADGLNAVEFQTPVGPQPLTLEMDLEVGRPPGHARGSTIDYSQAFNMAPGLPLAPGRYEWRLVIDEERRDEWRAAFTVREP